MWSAVTVRATQLELRFPGRAARGWRLSRPLDGHSSYMSLLATRALDAPERCLSSGSDAYALPVPAENVPSQRVRYGLSTRPTRLMYSYLIAALS